MDAAVSAANEETVVLFDAHDVPTGLAAKIEAHRFGLRHRAISIFVRNPFGELLIQRRSPAKYHSGGLWANACCSHPRPGEAALDAALRRLPEEMGFDCPRAAVRHELSGDPGQTEVVRAFGGVYDGPVAPDPAAVSDWRGIRLDELAQHRRRRPKAYTPWFRHYLDAHGDVIAAWLRA